jgi:hypothetical protein
MTLKLAGPIAVISSMLLSGTASQALQRPKLDSSFARLSLDYLETGNATLLAQIADTAAARHIGMYARRISRTTEGPTDAELVKQVLDKVRAAGLDVPATRKRLQAIERDKASLARCWKEAAAYLPSGALDRSTLYLQVGYDIGSAVAGDASLNIAHERFTTNPREIWLSCVYEVHRAGVQQRHELPSLSQARRVSDLAALVRYFTFLEGMAVHAARGWRAQRNALRADSDYVALGDPRRMTRYEQEYFRLYNEIAGDSGMLRETNWEIVQRMSTGDRLWYRVGALMAERIERARGREFLRRLVIEGPDRFFATYASLKRATQH